MAYASFSISLYTLAYSSSVSCDFAWRSSLNFSYFSLSSRNVLRPSSNLSFSIMMYSRSNSVSCVLLLIEIWANKIFLDPSMKSRTVSLLWEILSRYPIYLVLLTGLLCWEELTPLLPIDYWSRGNKTFSSKPSSPSFSALTTETSASWNILSLFLFFYVSKVPSKFWLLARGFLPLFLSP